MGRHGFSLGCTGSLHFLESNPLSDVRFVKTFPYSAGCLLTVINFDEINIVNLFLLFPGISKSYLEKDDNTECVIRLLVTLERCLPGLDETSLPSKYGRPSWQGICVLGC